MRYRSVGVVAMGRRRAGRASNGLRTAPRCDPVGARGSPLAGRFVCINYLVVSPECEDPSRFFSFFFSGGFLLSVFFFFCFIIFPGRGCLHTFSIRSRTVDGENNREGSPLPVSALVICRNKINTPGAGLESIIHSYKPGPSQGQQECRARWILLGQR